MQEHYWVVELKSGGAWCLYQTVGTRRAARAIKRLTAFQTRIRKFIAA